MNLLLDPQKMAALEERWSDISPDHGTEECICTLCGKMIGAHENDPRWRDHSSEWCIGCELCEIAIRIFWPRTRREKVRQIGTLEMRFHPKCFESLLL